jgi:phosphate/sulfate permease
MPVSTTFLLLSSFGASQNAITSVLNKSLLGYFIAFVTAFVLWILLDKVMKRSFRGRASNRWVIYQWLTSGFLWSLWIMQDAANIAVYLPRKLNFIEFSVFSITILIGLGIVLYLKGDKIQEIVEEKSEVKDVRPATIIDMAYTAILIFFTWINTIPMSTTWVFIGLLGGRELGIKLSRRKELSGTWRLIIKDVLYALTGLLISIIIAFAANENLRGQIFSLF